jgi:hypothetical protein
LNNHTQRTYLIIKYQIKTESSVVGNKNKKEIPSKSNDPYKQEKGDNFFHFILEPTNKKS